MSPHMLHHISLGVVDIVQSAIFYDAVLAPLGYVRVFSDIRTGETKQAVGYGKADGGDKLALKQIPEPLAELAGFHLAFTAPSHTAVADFHAAALKYGGQDNGAPGLRLHYGADYFAAFVIDPNGYRLEAVCKAPL